MGRARALTVLLLILAALGCAEAASTHQSFAVSSYSADGLRDFQGSQLPAVKQDHEAITTSIPNRYPNGYYPSTAQPYHSQTSQYNAFEKTDAFAERYPRGYYPNSHYTSGSNQLSSSSSQIAADNTRYTAADYKKASNPTSTIPDRYPQGYYPNYEYVGGDFTHSAAGNPNSKQFYRASYSTSNSQSTVVDPAGERYPHGYYPNSQYVTGSSAVSMPYDGARHSTQTTMNEQHRSSLLAGQRDPFGYSEYNAQSSSNAAVLEPFNKVHNSAHSMTEQQQTSQAAPAERYPHGYYPNSQYYHGSSSEATQSVHSGAFSRYQGNFKTLPYANNAREVAFEQAAAGCRTAYWVDNVDKWPKFFNAKSTVEDAFGSKAKEVLGETTILQALLNYSADAYSELARSACTALLNSYSRGGYKISHTAVIEQFNAALVSKEAATAQALIFDTANVESISAGSPCN